MTHLHSIPNLTPTYPSLVITSNSITLNYHILPCKITINIISNLLYSSNKILQNDPQILFISLWILISVSSVDLHISDGDISILTGIDKRKISKAKKTLLKTGYITTKTITINKVKGTQYTKGKHWSKLNFIESNGEDLTIPFPEKRERRTNKKPKLKNFKETKFIRPLTKDTISKINNNYYFYVNTEIRLPSDKHVTDLLNSKCGDKLVKDNSDRIRACATIIDLVRSSYYDEIKTNNITELDTFKFGGKEVIIYNPSDEYYRSISQSKFLKEIGNNKATSYNTDGLSAAKETLENLGWLQVKESRSRTQKNTRGKNQSYSSPNLKDPKPKEYKLTSKFYNNQIDSRSSELSLPISKKLSTPFKALAMAELDPQIFKYFEDLAKKTRQDKKNKEWNIATKSYQLSTLKNFDYNRGYSDKKYYKTVKNSRIYTSISRMPEAFRNYILIDGEETVEIDIKSAHAIFITLEMQNEKEIKKWLDLINGNYKSDHDEKDIYYYLIETLGIDPKSKKKYPTRQLQRKQCKLVLNAYFNGSTNQKNRDKELKFNTPILKYLKKEFPDLDGAIRGMLNDYRCSGMDGAALRLQEIESNVMGTYFMEHPDYTCISIHDGLRVKKSESKMFIDAVKERAKNLYGLDIIVDKK